MTSDKIPVANGTSTDHPYPGLPFVDDSHLPLDDLHAVEAVGRNAGHGMWGRHDVHRDGIAEFGYTTDPHNHRYGWVVQHHPEHGRVVLLYEDDDTGFVHQDFLHSGFMVTRSGGYLWDGSDWYRPLQILDWSTESLVFRRVPRATTIAVSDLLDSTCHPGEGEVRKVVMFEPKDVTPQQWRHDLALWAQQREGGGVRPAAECVVHLNAPELSETQLIGAREAAALAGLSESELRDKLVDRWGDLPLPQAGGVDTPRWAKPVIHDWIEARKRDRSTVDQFLYPGGDDEPIGWDETRVKITRVLDASLRIHGEMRRGFLRRRGVEGNRFLADDLARDALHQVQQSIPLNALLWSVEKSALWDLRVYSAGEKVHFTRMTGVMLGWVVRYYPNSAARVFGSIIREAADELGLEKDDVVSGLRSSVVLDGGFDTDQRVALKEFLSLVLPPAGDR